MNLWPTSSTVFYTWEKEACQQHMLRVWRHQLGDEENVANSGMVPDYNGIDKRYTPFLNPIKTSKGHGEYDIDQILEGL